MTLQQYISKINTLYKTGNAREHSYRGDLQNLIMAILPDVLVTNEPARVACGAPDYVLTKKDIPIGYIEAKDIGVDLNDKKLKEQFDRYKAGLTNLIFTDYLDFHFYKDGEFVTKIAIAKIENGAILPISENFDQFTNLIINFAQTISQTIKSPTKLAQMMAGKAKLMADVIEKSLHADDENQTRSSIKSQMLSFQQMLIHDIDNKAFADIYSQTIAYGMFAARYHDPTLPTFSREEAATLIPKSNPFLRKLFQDIAGYDLDTRLVWIVDELVSIFLASDVAQIMKNFGKSTKQEDPVVHFYETFLGEYNPALRKARGVWYTPQPVVNFIVRAVDDILKTEFNLKEGLADTSKIKIKKKAVTQTGIGANSKIKEVATEVEVHKVQILDPATGTGTFLAEVVKHIHKKFEGQQGIWSKYVTNDLIPRLNGFELLMASYAMAHLKMDMLLTETGYKPTDDQRFRIFLTNSLEEAHPDTQTLFSSWLSDEADQANAIKRDAPVMVVIGNPPYSVSSSNKSEWIQNLIKDYKKDLNERKINLDDDYIKFTRFGQHFIDKNGSGILAYISNNSFIDGITHRQMRKHLLESFDKIYILDLHGNARKKEVCPDGSIDQNVFDIMAGVSINIFVKTIDHNRKQLGEVFHHDLYGKREFKYQNLEKQISKFEWTKIEYEKPYYFFVPKDFEEQKNYNEGFLISNIFNKHSAGIKTKVDHIAIDFNKENLNERINDIITNKLSFDEIRLTYGLSDRTTWEYKPDSNLLYNFGNISEYEYRPFDYRFTYFEDKFLSRSRKEIMNNFFKKRNIGIESSRNGDFIFIGKNISDEHFISDNSFKFPLYLYPETTTQQSLLDEVVRTPNLNMELVNKMAEKLGIPFVAEKDLTGFENQLGMASSFSPIDILDYIYAVLHSPSYRSKYKEFLKIDFPRVPYPKTYEVFKNLIGLGSQLRQIHLLESDVVDTLITQYPEDGTNIVVKPRYENSPPLESNLKNYKLNSPPLEGCLKGGVVADVIINNTPIYFNPKLDLPCNIKLKPRAKALRQAENLSEVLFWMQVTKGQFYKIDFDRQRIIGNYIVDFYVKKLGLIIEIDGSSHDNKQEYDAKRDAYFESLGLKVYHIPVVEVLQQMKLVMRKLEEFIINNYNLPPRLSGTPPEEGNLPPHTTDTPTKEGNLPPHTTDTPTKEGNLGRVFINETQYFANVPEVAWNFYIGGYQPAQKWLKDRKDRELSYEDIRHYQKIIVALTETDRLMKEIDAIAF